VPDGLGEVVVVEGVLRPGVAADVALAAQPAGVAGPAVQVVGAPPVAVTDRLAGDRRSTGFAEGHRQ
jgi:hypothetical protein